MRLLVALALFAFLTTVEAGAHSWYPKECCDEGDCVVASKVVVRPNGDHWVYTRKFGVVRIARGYLRYARPSSDLNYHVCVGWVGDDPDVVRCYFVPGQS